MGLLCECADDALLAEFEGLPLAELEVLPLAEAEGLPLADAEDLLLPQVRFLNSVAWSYTVPLEEAIACCVRCVQLWKMSLLQLYVVSCA